MINIFQIFGVMLILTSQIVASDDCLYKSCNPSIEYAMGKQRDSLEHRLNDLIGALEQNNQATKDQTFIITYETNAYMQLRERLKIETIILDKALLYSHKSKEIAELLKSINIIKQNKENK